MRKDPAMVPKSKNGDVNGIESTAESEWEARRNRNRKGNRNQMRKDPAIVRKSKNGDVNGIGSTTESESESESDAEGPCDRT